MEIVVVLCRAETSLNVGAVCRVMANCDLKNLRIVADKNIYNETEVLTLALHARPIWDEAEFFPATLQGLKDAIKDCNAVFATTRREGAKRKHAGLSPVDFVRLSHREKYQKVAIVFGNERTGLTDEEVAVCSHSINIPSSSSYPSYNLSHAVLIVAYTFFTYEKEWSHSQKTLSLNEGLACEKKNEELAPSIDAFGVHNDLTIPLLRWKEKNEQKMLTFATSCEIAEKIVMQLKDMGLYQKGGDSDCQIFLSHLLLRAKITEEEADFFANIFNKLFYGSKKK